MFVPRVTTPVRAVIFDFGGVLYTYNYWILMRDFAKELNISADLASQAWETRIEEFERGEITEKDFWQAFRITARVRAEDSFLHDVFVRQFAPMPDSIHISLALKKRYMVGLLSNNCAWEADLEKRLQFRHNYDLVIMSYQVGCRKPEPRIFQVLTEKTGCRPEEIVFVDDTASYADVVTQAGIHFIPFRNAQQLSEDLHLLGVWW